MQDPLRFKDLPEETQIHLKEIAEDTRLWSHERSPIGQAIDFIDDRVEEASGRIEISLWRQLVLLLYNTIFHEDDHVVRESWLAIGEVRQAIRQAMILNPMVGAGAESEIYLAQFAEHMDYILFQLSPDPKTLS